MSKEEPDKVISMKSGLPLPKPGEPEPGLVDMFETLLAMAKSGEIIGAATAYLHQDGGVGFRYDGRGATGPGMIGEVALMHHHMLTRSLERN